MKNRFTRLLAGILLALLLVPGLPAHAAEHTGGVTLKDADSGALLPFQVPNLFPGDSVTKEYVVTTVHDGPITLHYHADIRPDAGYRKLAEVLKVRIELPDEKLLLYDGLMQSMPPSLEHDLASGEKTVTYRITAYLDTSVGNAYMDKTLVADFRWWYLDEAGIPVTITAEKTMDGQYARGEDFSFVLLDEGGNVVSQVRNDDGHIEFDTLYFFDPGTYTYTFREVKGRNDRVTYDPAVYKAVITVAENGEYTVTYSRNGQSYSAGLPRFTNVSKGADLPDDPSDVKPENPKTGDPFPLKLYSIIAISALAALLCLLLLWKDRKKEDQP